MDGQTDIVTYRVACTPLKIQPVYKNYFSLFPKPLALSHQMVSGFLTLPKSSKSVQQIGSVANLQHIKAAKRSRSLARERSTAETGEMPLGPGWLVWRLNWLARRLKGGKEGYLVWGRRSTQYMDFFPILQDLGPYRGCCSKQRCILMVIPILRC